MVSKKNKSKIWEFRPHIQDVPWDFLLPSSTLAFKVVINKEFKNMEWIGKAHDLQKYLIGIASDPFVYIYFLPELA